MVVVLPPHLGVVMNFFCCTFPNFHLWLIGITLEIVNICAVLEWEHPILTFQTYYHWCFRWIKIFVYVLYIVTTTENNLSSTFDQLLLTKIQQKTIVGNIKAIWYNIAPVLILKGCPFDPPQWTLAVLTCRSWVVMTHFRGFLKCSRPCEKLPGWLNEGISHQIWRLSG